MGRRPRQPESARCVGKGARPRCAPSWARRTCATSRSARQGSRSGARGGGGATELAGQPWRRLDRRLRPPSRYLPSRKTQERRRAALPDAATLERNLGCGARTAVPRRGLRAVPRSRGAGARRPADARELRGSALGLKVEALLVEDGDAGRRSRRCAVCALRPSSLRRPRGRLRAARPEGGSQHPRERLSQRVAAAVALGLAASPRSSPWDCAARAAPRACSCRYSLCAARRRNPAAAGRGSRCFISSLCCWWSASASTTRCSSTGPRPKPTSGSARCCRSSCAARRRWSAFGCLALSRTPVLRAIGVTVALGTVAVAGIAAALSVNHGPTARLGASGTFAAFRLPLRASALLRRVESQMRLEEQKPRRAPRASGTRRRRATTAGLPAREARCAAPSAGRAWPGWSSGR